MNYIPQHPKTWLEKVELHLTHPDYFRPNMFPTYQNNDLIVKASTSGKYFKQATNGKDTRQVKR